MKIRVRLLLAVILAVPLVPIASITAMDDTPTTTGSEPTTNSSTAPEEPTVEEDTTKTDYQTKLKERLAARKAALKTRLTKAEDARVKLRCKASQESIKVISTKAKEVKVTREDVYSKIDTKLTALSAALKKHSVDTTELDAEIIELEAKIATFKTDMASLRQAASDVSNMDCTADPSGFKASLDTLRTARETLSKDSIAIRSYIKDTIKPTLETLKKSVSDEHSSEGSN